MTPPPTPMPKRRAAAEPKAKIQTTLGELVGASAAIGRLLSIPLPTKLGYHLAKLGRLVEAEVKVYNERWEALAKELGEEREPTEAEAAQGASKMFKIKTENRQRWADELKTLEAIPVTLDWAPFNLSDVPDGTLSGRDILNLGALVIEASEP